MKIKSIQVGLPKTVEHNGKMVTTGIFKEPVNGPIMLKTLNLVGDGQADLKVHGGLDKALYAYPNDVYSKWIELRPQDQFPSGAMGENLTLDFLPEEHIYIGDVYELGDSIVQVTQPRFPCYKLAVKFNDPKIIKQFMTLNHPGVYFRILKEGLVDVGNELKLISREKILLSVVELFQLQKSDLTLARVEDILEIQSLPEDWKEHFRTMKNKLKV